MLSGTDHKRLQPKPNEGKFRSHRMLKSWRGWSPNDINSLDTYESRIMHIQENHSRYFWSFYQSRFSCVKAHYIVAKLSPGNFMLIDKVSSFCRRLSNKSINITIILHIAHIFIIFKRNTWNQKNLSQRVKWLLKSIIRINSNFYPPV